MSRPTVSKAKTSYPIFAANFATSRPAVLVVGGGGGGGRHGVKNQITAFDFSSRAPTVESFAEIEASTDDSVTCLANLATRDGLVLYAGINSSEEDRLRGANEHFRAFELSFPKSTSSSGKGEKSEATLGFLSKASLFAPPKTANGKKEGYQRIVKLSPAQRSASGSPSRRIGAIASSLAGDENEVVIFSATSNKPQKEDIIGRIMLHKGQEANDIDIFTREEGKFRVTYVVDQEVFVQDVNYDFNARKAKGKNLHRKVYAIPSLGSGPRSKLRCVRWLSPTHLLLLTNKPNRTGVELLVLHLYEEGPGSIIARKSLPRHIKAATDLDVALLDKDADGAYQIAIAIAAIDISVNVYTMDYHGPAKDSLSSLHAFNSYENVHDVQITKAVFSPYHPQDPSAKKVPQYLRLATTSLGNTISVETFPLISHGSRHVLQTARSRNLFTAATYLVIAMVVAVIALLIQSLIDPEGNLTKSILPASLQNAAAQHKTFGETLRDKRHEAILNKANAPVVKTTQRIADLLHVHLPHVLSNPEAEAPVPSTASKALVIRHNAESDGTLSAEVHDDHETVLEKHGEAKKWDDLSKEEQALWIKKLSDAGMWTMGEGTTILKSIFFGQIGGLVGQVAQGVIG